MQTNEPESERTERYSYRLVGLSASSLVKFKEEFEQIEYKVGRFFKDKNQFVVSIGNFSAIDTQKLKSFIKEYQLGHGLYMSLITEKDMDGISVPSNVSDFYLIMGGSLDVSFSYSGDDENND